MGRDLEMRRRTPTTRASYSFLKQHCFPAFSRAARGEPGSTGCHPSETLGQIYESAARTDKAKISLVTPSVSTQDEGALLKMALRLRDVIRAAAAC